MAGYSQNDPRWSGDKLGTSTYWTMGAAGCYVTSGADVLKAFGHDITPGDLNRLATSKGLIDSNGDVTRWDWLAVLFPDVCKFIEMKDWGAAAADLHYFDIKNDLNTEIILMIDDSPAAGMQTHFMRTVGWDGGTDVIVDDSWDAIRKGVSAYAARFGVHPAAIIYKAVKYVKVTSPAPNPNITLDQLNQVYQDLLHRAPDQGGIDHYVGHYTYDFVVNDLKNSAEYATVHAPQPTPTPAVPTPVENTPTPVSSPAPEPTPEPVPAPVIPPVVSTTTISVPPQPVIKQSFWARIKAWLSKLFYGKG